MLIIYKENHDLNKSIKTTESKKKFNNINTLSETLQYLF